MFTKVLFPIDLDEEDFSLEALDYAVEETRKDHAELYILTVLPPAEQATKLNYPRGEGAVQSIEQSAHEHLDALVREHVPEDVRATKIVRRGVSPSDEILGQAEKNNVDLIVIPCHDRGLLEGFLLGSVTTKVVRHAHCSVLVMRRPRK